MKFVNLDVAKDYDLLVQLIKEEQPDSIVHFAEQRAAPYSMKSSRQKRYTVDNNLNATNTNLDAETTTTTTVPPSSIPSASTAAASDAFVADPRPEAGLPGMPLAAPAQLGSHPGGGPDRAL